MHFYEKTIRTLQRDGLIDSSHCIVVSCGGEADILALSSCGLDNAVITNIDNGQRGGEGLYKWQHCDAEHLPFEDESFDWGFVHAGLHHCASPHRGLLELLRVARKGILVIEARDSFTMRLAVRLGLTSDYEIEAAAMLQGGGGGVGNSGVPNFVYRWTENEVRKTIESAYPERLNRIRFFYGLRLPNERHTMSRPLKRHVVKVLGLGVKALVKLAPSQGNEFAFVILKSTTDKPWIKRSHGAATLDTDYRLGFDTRKYVKNKARAPSSIGSESRSDANRLGVPAFDSDSRSDAADRSHQSAPRQRANQ